MHYKTFNDIVRQPEAVVPGHSLRNINKMLVEYPGAQGVKTGYTGRAGLCLVTSAARNGRQLISVVLNAPKWTADSTALLDYGFAQLAVVPASRNAQRLGVAAR
jgi:D-alanyl-D-alanine carboxypeptidase (penicillin-binding protein 5/6)